MSNLLTRLQNEATPINKPGSLVGLLKEIWAEHADELPSAYKWEDESDRWYELIYCIFLRRSQMAPARLRMMIDAMNTLDLLSVESLTKLPTRGGALNWDDGRCSLLLDILVARGMARQEAMSCLQTVAEAANGLASKYKGKLQKLIRSQLEPIVRTLDETFRFSQLNERDEVNMLVHWLQNAFEFPLALSNPYVEQFCRENNVSTEALEDAADQLDINLSVVDDLLEIYMVNKNKSRV